MPPSESAIVIGKVACALPSLRSRRVMVESPQFGTHTLPNPAARPEHGCVPTVMVAITAALFGSSRETLFLGEFETHTSLSTAIQSGAPGTSYTASGFSLVIGMRTPRAVTPGRLGLCG